MITQRLFYHKNTLRSKNVLSVAIAQQFPKQKLKTEKPERIQTPKRLSIVNKPVPVPDDSFRKFVSVSTSTLSTEMVNLMLEEVSTAQDAFKLLEKLQATHKSLVNYTFTKLLRKAVDLTESDCDKLREIAENNFGLKYNEYSICALVSRYAKLGAYDKEREVLEKAKSLNIEPTAKIYEQMIRGRLHKNELQAALDIYTTMIKNNKYPNKYLYTDLITITYRENQPDTSRLIAKDYLQYSNDIDEHLFTSILKTIKNDQNLLTFISWFLALKGDSIGVRSYAIILETLGIMKLYDQMDIYFELIHQKGIQPLYLIYLKVIAAHAHAGHTTKMESIIERMKENNIDLDIKMITSIINHYALIKDYDNLLKYIKIMKDKRIQPDSMLLRYVLKAFSNKDSYLMELFQLYDFYSIHKKKEDYRIILSALVKSKSYDKIRILLDNYLKLPKQDPTILINFYTSIGDLDKAEQIGKQLIARSPQLAFDGLPALIDAFEEKGNTSKVTEYSLELRKLNSLLYNQEK